MSGCQHSSLPTEPVRLGPYLWVAVAVWFFTGIASINGFTFFLDTPTIATMAKNGPIWQDAASGAASGRYFPIFWFVNHAGWHLSGGSIAGMQAMQVAIFGGILAVIGGILRVFGVRSAWILAAAGLLTVIRPAAEVLMTVGKAEMIVSLLVLCALLAMFADPVLRGTQPTGRTWFFPAAYWVAVVLAVWAKETAAVLLVAAAAGAAFALAAPSGRRLRSLARSGVYLAVTVAGILAARLPVIFHSPRAAEAPTAASYGAFRPSLESITDNLGVYLTVCPELVWLLPGLGVLTAVCFWKAGLVEDSGRSLRAVAGATVFWATGAAYFAGLQLWRWGSVYYMYPAYLFVGIALVLCISSLWMNGRVARGLAIVLLAGFLVAKAHAGLGFIGSAAVQRMTARQYSELIDLLQRESGGNPDAWVFLLDHPRLSEPPIQTNIMLALLGAKNIKVVGALELMQPVPPSPNTALLAGIDVGPENLRPQPGDFVVQFDRDFPVTTEIRGVTDVRRLEPKDLEKAAGLKCSVRATSSEETTVPVGLSLSRGIKRVVIRSGYELQQVDSP